MAELLTADLVTRLRAEVVVPYKEGYEPFRAPPSKLMTDAADEIERLRAELARINGLAVHLSSGGRDPDEKCYTKRDVEALIAITRAVEKKHDTKRRGDKSYLDGKGGHFWTCAKCQYVNDAGIRFNRCGECGEFQSGYADTRSGEPHG